MEEFFLISNLIPLSGFPLIQSDVYHESECKVQLFFFFLPLQMAVLSSPAQEEPDKLRTSSSHGCEGKLLQPEPLESTVHQTAKMTGALQILTHPGVTHSARRCRSC